MNQPLLTRPSYLPRISKDMPIPSNSVQTPANCPGARLGPPGWADEERFKAMSCVGGFTTCSSLIVEYNVEALFFPSPPTSLSFRSPLPLFSPLPFPALSPSYPHNPLSLYLSLTLLSLLLSQYSLPSPPSSVSLHSLLPSSLPFLLLSVLPPPPCSVLHEVAAMNNYFGIGFDAKIMYEFRTRREENPKQYTSV